MGLRPISFGRMHIADERVAVFADPSDPPVRVLTKELAALVSSVTLFIPTSITVAPGLIGIRSNHSRAADRDHEYVCPARHGREIARSRMADRHRGVA